EQLQPGRRPQPSARCVLVAAARRPVVALAPVPGDRLGAGGLAGRAGAQRVPAHAAGHLRGDAEQAGGCGERGAAGGQPRPADPQQRQPHRRRRQRRQPAVRPGQQLRQPLGRHRPVRGRGADAEPDADRRAGEGRQHPARAGQAGRGEQRPADHPHRGALRQRRPGSAGPGRGRRPHTAGRGQPLPDVPDLPPHAGGADAPGAPQRGGHHRGHPHRPAHPDRRAGQPSGRDAGAGRPSGRREPCLGQPARPDAGPRQRRPGPAGGLDELHGERAAEADQHPRGAVGGPAAVRLRRLARAAHPADHRADGRRGAARRARGLRPHRRPVDRAAAERARPVRGAADRPAGDLPVRRRCGGARAQPGGPARRRGAGGRGQRPAGHVEPDHRRRARDGAGHRGGRRPPDRAHPAQPAGQRHRARGDAAHRDPPRQRRRGRRRGRPRPRRGVRGQSGSAGLPPVLAGRPGPRPDRRRHRARVVDLHGGRQPARRLADGVGPPRPGRAVPAHAAPEGRDHPAELAPADGAARLRRAQRPGAGRGRGRRQRRQQRCGSARRVRDPRPRRPAGHQRRRPVPGRDV
ncbi:MAG: Two component system sensor histidine kinase MtrB, partial [uncultured Friedmanniella sp.]